MPYNCVEPNSMLKWGGGGGGGEVKTQHPK